MTDHDKPAFAAAMAQLALALRDHEPDAAQLRTYFEALKDLEIEFVVGAAARLQRQAEWFPKTSEWREAANKVQVERVEAQRALMRKMPAPLCRACDDTSWEPTPHGVKPCACRQQRWLEVLGRRPWPALPETTEPRIAVDAPAIARVLASAKEIR